ncbi:uncharacterized protein LOC131573853 isoform X2 [Poecile atricapillus]|uniref:uncharacterized protein LOC131573853 isoform X2 n=1 Tax=Poecile atricapillus TaxID=48891 RepID=UPI002738C1FE|nr:uncharacterized protein LOC131573853 isoform X2 [Poecile atricapillus]
MSPGKSGTFWSHSVGCDSPSTSPKPAPNPIPVAVGTGFPSPCSWNPDVGLLSLELPKASVDSVESRCCSPGNPPDVPPSVSPIPAAPVQEMQLRNRSQLPSVDPAAQGGLGSHPWGFRGQQDIPHKLLVVSPLGSQGTAGHPTQTPCCVTPGESGDNRTTLCCVTLGSGPGPAPGNAEKFPSPCVCSGNSGILLPWKLQGLGFRSFSFSHGNVKAFCVGSDIPGNAAPSLCLSKVYFGASEQLVSSGGKGMFGSHYSSFLCCFFFKRSAPEIEPQSPVSITCPIIQLGLFHSMKAPLEPVTGFQLSHLQLSSFWWRFALGEREKELFWMETGRKIIPGAAHPPLPWEPKNGICTEIPSLAGNLDGFIPKERLGGFVLQFSFSRI